MKSQITKPAVKAMALFVSLICAMTQAQSPKPNVIMIYTDDMGYSDISSFSNVDLPVTTPNIDRLANEGMKFTHFYVSMPICSPSRAAVISGMFAPRNQLTTFLETRQHNVNASQNDYLDPALAHLPKAFQAAGYATGHIGKWHLGGGRDIDNAPTIRQYGYDEAYSTWESPNPDPQLGVIYAPWDAQQRTEPGQVPRHQRTEYMVNRTLDFLSRHQDKPCFITLWPDDVHTPFAPNAAMIAKWGGTSDWANTRQNFYAVLDEYDRQIGRLLDGIRDRGLEENTIIFFTGDNGPNPSFGTERTNGMRGRKSSVFEGGIRQPFLIRWKDHIPAGVTNSQTVLSTVDLLPTLTGLAGVALSPTVLALANGEDLSAAMLGTAVTRTKPLFWEFGHTSSINPSSGPRLAMREGDFKLLMNADQTGKQLYNVRTDPNETTDLKASQTARVNDMTAKLLAWKNGLPNRTHPFPIYTSVDFNQYSVAIYADVAALQSSAGASSTARIDGVTVAPNGQDDVFAIHVDDAGRESYLRIDYPTGSVEKLFDEGTISADIGVPGVNRELRGGFDYSPPGDRLFFSETTFGNSNSALLAATNVGTRTTRRILESQVLGGLSDLVTLQDGLVAVTRGAEGNRTVGTIVPPTGVWTQRISEANLIAAAPGNTQLIPGSLGANSSNGQTYLFAEGDGEAFFVTGLQSAPAITRLTQSVLAPANLQDIAVDQAGNMFGLDTAGNQIIVKRAQDGAMYTISLATIAAKLGSATPIAVTARRGLAARMFNQNHAELYLASADDRFGVVRIRFGTIPANVGGWELY